MNDESPGGTGALDTVSSSTAHADQAEVRTVDSTVSPTKELVVADEPWRENLRRMAIRAAREPGFYEISGGTVQRLADELRHGGAA